MVSGVGGPRAPRRGLGVEELEGADEGGGAKRAQAPMAPDDAAEEPGVGDVGAVAHADGTQAKPVTGVEGADETGLRVDGADGFTAMDGAFDAASTDMERGLAAQGALGTETEQQPCFDFELMFPPREEYEWWLGDDQPWKDLKPHFGELQKGLKQIELQLNREEKASTADNGMSDPSLVDPAARMQKDLDQTLEEQRRMGLGGVVAGRYDDPTRR